MSRSPKVILYCEYYRFMGGALFKNNEMGFITLYKNQFKALDRAGIAHTEDLSTDGDVFQATAQGLRTLYLIKRFRSKGKKTIIYACATAEELGGAFRFLGFFTKLYRIYLTYLYKSADKVICISEYTLDLIEKKYFIPKEKLVLISSGTDTNLFVPSESLRQELRSEQGIKDDEIVVANVSMVLEKKGTGTFIKLGKAFKHIKFVWYGKIFKKFLVPGIDANTPNIRFYGYIKSVIAAYSSADIFVFPSYEENQGISVLEAGSMSLPIVVRDIPVHSWLTHGVNCLKASTQEDFEEVIQKLSNNKELRESLGKAARELVVEEHSLDAVGEKLKALYNSLI